MMPIFVSHFTTGTAYEVIKEKLIASLQRHKLEYDIEGIPSTGSWRANSNHCAVQVQQMLKKYPGRAILRLDADAIVQRLPVALDDLDCDVAGVIWKQSKLRPIKGELLGGTLYFKNTLKSREIVDEWVRLCKKNRRARNSDLLQFIIKERSAQIKFVELPLAYCTIFDSMASQVSQPVIEHFQASRTHKKEINKMMNQLRGIQELYQYKKSDVAVFLGSGSSILNITPEQWEAIKLCDTMTLNNWVYWPAKDFTPNFYHVETKWYGWEILRKRFMEKAKQYRECKFIFPKDKAIKLKDKRRVLVRDTVPAGIMKFEYGFDHRDRKRTHRPFNAAYGSDVNNHRLVKSYDMSVTILFDLLYRFGYKTIITFGIDLNNSLYFWSSGDKKYGEVHHLTNKAHEGKPPMDPHGTIGSQNFIKDFDDKKMKPFGRKIYVGHKNTALYPLVDFKEITELIG